MAELGSKQVFASTYSFKMYYYYHDTLWIIFRRQTICLHIPNKCLKGSFSFSSYANISEWPPLFIYVHVSPHIHTDRYWYWIKFFLNVLCTYFLNLTWPFLLLERAIQNHECLGHRATQITIRNFQVRPSAF